MDLNKAYKALKNAHNAGDVDAARTIAKAINNFNKETEDSETDYDLQDATVAGMTLGISNKARALGGAAGDYVVDALTPEKEADFGRSYDESTERIQQARRNYLNQNPYLGGGAEIAGGVFTGLPVIHGLLKSAPTILGRIGHGALGGSGVGAVAGYGFSEREPVRETLEGAAFGGAVGGLIPAAIPAISKIAKPILSRVNVRTPAQKKLAEALGVGSRQAEKRLSRLGPEATIADLTPEARLLARDVRATRVPGTTRAEILYKRRARAQPDRLSDAVENHLTQTNDAYTRGKQLIVARKEAANVAYKEANESIRQYVSEGINELIENPTIKSLIKKIKQVPKYKDLEDNSSEVLDQVYKFVGKRARTSGDDQYLNQTLARDLREAMVAENPAYGKALQQFSDDMGLEEALQLGRRFLKENPKRISDLLDNMSGAEKTEYLTGVADAIIEKIEKGVRGRDRTAAIFGSPRQEKQLARLFPSRKNFLAFKKEILREAEFAETKKNVLMGSPTQDKRAGAEALNVTDAAGVVYDASRGDTVNLARRGVQAVRNIGKKPNRKIAEELAKMLFNQDPSANLRTLRMLKGRPASEVLNQQNQNKLAAALIAGSIAENNRR